MVSEDDAIAAQGLAGGANALIPGVIGENEITLKTANFCCRSHVMSCFQLQKRRPLTA